MKEKTQKIKKNLKVKKDRWFSDWKTELSEYKYLILLSILLLILAGVATFFASTYVDNIQTAPVPDLILDNIPTMNMDIIYSYGIILLGLALFFYTILLRVKEFHTIAVQFSLLILVRSIFIMLTHLGVPTDADIVMKAPEAFLAMNFHNDLFFSGHAALPFMAFLIFRKEWIGKIFFIFTIILSATVLLMHVHYSIDVFSAYFITYGVYKFGQWLTAKEFWHKASR